MDNLWRNSNIKVREIQKMKNFLLFNTFRGKKVWNLLKAFKLNIIWNKKNKNYLKNWKALNGIKYLMT